MQLAYMGLTKEELKAVERIGETSANAFQWLIRFATTEVSVLSDGQWGDLYQELDVFIRFGPPSAKLRPAGGKVGWVPTRKYAVAMQQIVRSCLEQLIDTGHTRFPNATIAFTILGPKLVGPDRCESQANASNPTEAFSFHAAQLTMENGARLRRCPECHAIFLADRRNQRYCSTRCLGRVTQRRFRAQKGDKEAQKTRTTKHVVKEKSSHGKARRKR